MEQTQETTPETDEAERTLLLQLGGDETEIRNVKIVFKDPMEVFALILRLSRIAEHLLLNKQEKHNG